MSQESRFQISVSDDALTLLHRKLADARFPDELSDVGWAYGVPLSDVKRLVSKWKDGYDWRAHERELNKLPIGGFGVLNVHYVHQRSEVENAIPLLFVHGWPGSFIEVTKMLPLLTATGAGNPSFHVVAPSLPGYAWSEAASNRGFRSKNYAEIQKLFNKLMLSLGYSEYVTQGGDWGHVLTRVLASRYGPQHGEREDLALNAAFQVQGNGYLQVQATRPQTLGYGLADSPVGMLAWIYEKLVQWTDSYPWTDEEVLTWISIFCEIYYEVLGSSDILDWHQSQVAVPIGISFFPKEMCQSPRAFLRAEANVVFESEHDAGGHFAAYEKPEALEMI
ncbi:Alpha/Beta hydrolase protein [Russula vinacea]|nr:Alpha/Beta hydrolase protein [Russula vinacea]